MQVRISSGKFSALINSSGAEICSIADNNGLEYIWQGDQNIWPRHAPILFPIVGRLKNNEFYYDKNVYQLGQHGFARDHEFELLKSTATFCCFQLKSDRKTKERYPFDFILQVNYELQNNKISCSYRVINPSKGDILFSLGAHPGFNCPIESGESFEDYYLEFNTQQELFHTELVDGLRTTNLQKTSLQNGTLFLKANLFDNDALVFEGLQIKSLNLCSAVSSHKIRIDCPNWPYFGIWTKKNNTKFVCLEPWFGVADHVNSKGDLTNKEGILRLPANEEFNCSFSITIE